MLDGRLRTLVACDAHHVLALHDGWLGVAADAPMMDVCIDVLDRQIDVWSSSPVSRLRLQGGIVSDVAVIRLNGRELPEYARERLDWVVAFASDWGEPGRILPCAASRASQI
jgi:hypothetical protein